MKLYRYWAHAERAIKDSKGNPLRLKKWGGSNESPEDAAETAKRAVNALAERLAARPDFIRWKRQENFGTYLYGARDLPEEIIESIDDANGITRNRYGCLVLNTETLMFVDIDFPALTFGQKLGKLFGKAPPDPKAAALARLKEWLSRHGGVGARLYATAAGLRYVFTDAPRAPDATALSWLKELGADALYSRLCKSQECFRARLSPKPWRLNMSAPPNFYPREPKQLAAFARWLSDYESKSRAFASCAFLEHWGNTDIAPALARLVERHDAMCKAQSRLKLA